MPIQLVNNSSSSFDIDFIIKASVLNKFNDFLEKQIYSFTVSTNNISRIAIIGYGITYDSVVLLKVLNIVKNFDFDIYNIDITNAKIIITFKEKIQENLLELLHNELF